MSTNIKNGDTFDINYNGERYACTNMSTANRRVVQVKFKNSSLFLVQSTSMNGEPFWGTMPEDLKLKGTAAKLGAEIEKHLI